MRPVLTAILRMLCGLLLLSADREANASNGAHPLLDRRRCKIIQLGRYCKECTSVTAIYSRMSVALRDAWRSYDAMP